MRSPALVAILVTGALALAGCAPTPASDPASQTSATPSASAEPATVPKRIVITATELQLFGDTGDLASTLTYFDSTEVVVTALSDQFGSDPVLSTTPGDCCHEFPSTVYTWGGFTLRDSEREVVAPTSEEFSVQATSAATDGVVVETIDGIRIGDDATKIAATHPGAEHRIVDAGVESQYFTVGEVTLDIPMTGSDEMILSISLLTDQPDGAISSIAAPACNFCGAYVQGLGQR